MSSADYWGQRLRDSLVRGGVPENLHDGLVLWVTDGVQPSSFLRAVLRNDLRDALARADGFSMWGLHALVCSLHNDAPGPAWGSQVAVDVWKDGCGLRGPVPPDDAVQTQIGPDGG